MINPFATSCSKSTDQGHKLAAGIQKNYLHDDLMIDGPAKMSNMIASWLLRHGGFSHDRAIHGAVCYYSIRFTDCYNCTNCFYIDHDPHADYVSPLFRAMHGYF